MVYVHPDSSEEVTDTFETQRDGNRGVMVETNEGYFEYWFPYVDTADTSYVDDDTMLDATHMTIRENAENPSEYDGTSSLTVPRCVVDSAESVSGLTLLE